MTTIQQKRSSTGIGGWGGLRKVKSAQRESRNDGPTSEVYSGLQRVIRVKLLVLSRYEYHHRILLRSDNFIRLWYLQHPLHYVNVSTAASPCLVP